MRKTYFTATFFWQKVGALRGSLVTESRGCTDVGFPGEQAPLRDRRSGPWPSPDGDRMAGPLRPSVPAQPEHSRDAGRPPRSRRAALVSGSTALRRGPRSHELATRVRRRRCVQLPPAAPVPSARTLGSECGATPCQEAPHLDPRAPETCQTDVPGPRPSSRGLFQVVMGHQQLQAHILSLGACLEGPWARCPLPPSGWPAHLAAGPVEGKGMGGVA